MRNLTSLVGGGSVTSLRSDMNHTVLRLMKVSHGSKKPRVVALASYF